MHLSRELQSYQALRQLADRQNKHALHALITREPLLLNRVTSQLNLAWWLLFPPQGMKVCCKLLDYVLSLADEQGKPCIDTSMTYHGYSMMEFVETFMPEQKAGIIRVLKKERELVPARKNAPANPALARLQRFVGDDNDDEFNEADFADATIGINAFCNQRDNIEKSVVKAAERGDELAKKLLLLLKTYDEKAKQYDSFRKGLPDGGETLAQKKAIVKQFLHVLYAYTDIEYLYAEFLLQEAHRAYEASVKTADRRGLTVQNLELAAGTAIEDCDFRGASFSKDFSVDIDLLPTSRPLGWRVDKVHLDAALRERNLVMFRLILAFAPEYKACVYDTFHAQVGLFERACALSFIEPEYKLFADFLLDDKPRKNAFGQTELHLSLQLHRQDLIAKISKRPQLLNAFMRCRNKRRETLLHLAVVHADKANFASILAAAVQLGMLDDKSIIAGAKGKTAIEIAVAEYRTLKTATFSALNQQALIIVSAEEMLQRIMLMISEGADLSVNNVILQLATLAVEYELEQLVQALLWSPYCTQAVVAHTQEISARHKLYEDNGTPPIVEIVTALEHYANPLKGDRLLHLGRTHTAKCLELLQAKDMPAVKICQQLQTYRQQQRKRAAQPVKFTLFKPLQALKPRFNEEGEFAAMLRVLTVNLGNDYFPVSRANGYQARR